MKRVYKYKREHFNTQEEFDHFKRVRTETQKRWLRKKEEKNPHLKEKRLLRQRLYSRYYSEGHFSLTFLEWMQERYSCSNPNSASIEELRNCLRSKS